MTIQFGTDGVRGVAGRTPITPEVAVAIGRAAARLAGGGRVLVAADPRPSSRWLADAVAAGAAAAGAQVGNAGVTPTAALGLALADGLGDAGVMVTASHNPWPENGFKVFGAGGAKLDDAAAREVEAWLQEPASEATPGEVSDVGPAVLGGWAARMEVALSGDLSAFAGKKIAIDLANGAATAVWPWLRDRVPATWVLLGAGGRPNDGVGSEHPEALRAAVREHGCDAGIAVDGDADRCLLVAEGGVQVSGDALLGLLARDRRVDRLVVTVMSTTALEAALPGVEVVRTAVGDRYVKEGMTRTGAPLGGEESGHVLFADFPAGDGLLTGLRSLAAAWRAAPTIGAAVADFRPFPRVLTKLKVARRPALDGLPELVAAQREATERLGPNGRVFLRYSGTEPYLRALVEGPDADAVRAASDAVCAVIRELGLDRP